MLIANQLKFCGFTPHDARCHVPPVGHVTVLEKHYFYDHYRQQSDSERTPGIWTSFISFIHIKRRYINKSVRDMTESPHIPIAKKKSEFMISSSEETRHCTAGLFKYTYYEVYNF
jgi:hypothetical protein